MNMQKLIIPALLILALTGIVYRATRPHLEPEKYVKQEKEEAPKETISGMLTYGAEVRSFVPCGVAERDAGWMTFGDPNVASDLRQVYEEATAGRLPYTPVFATIVADIADTPAEGFGADYATTYIVEKIQEIDANRTCQSNDITLHTPLSGSSIQSPLIITGEARGTWFFEGSMSVVLTNWDGEIIAEGVLQADGEWMTESLVAFYGELEYETPAYGERGHLIIQAANPSGLPEHDKALEIIVQFSEQQNENE